MTTLSASFADQRAALSAAVVEVVTAAPDGLTLEELLKSVPRDQQAPKALVLGAMWQLVDDGRLHYGSDARVSVPAPLES